MDTAPASEQDWASMAALGSNVAHTRPPTTSPSPGCVFDQLRAYVARCGGDDTMLYGWSAETAAREPTNPEEKPITDKFYHDPHGKTFNSMASVVRSLGLEALRDAASLGRSSDPAALEKLRAYVARCGGNDAVLDGWSAQTAVREPTKPGARGASDSYYHDPQGKTFTSMASVVRSLGLEDLRDAGRSSDPTALGNLREYEAGCGSDEDTLDGWTAQVRQPAAAHPAVRINHVFIDSQRRSSRPMTAVATTLAERQGPRCSQRPVKRRRTSDDYISETESRGCGAPSTHRGPWPGCATVPSDTQRSTLPAYDPEAASEASLLLDADNVRVLDDAGDVWDGSDVLVVCAEVIG